jgi:arylsulfatase
MRHQYGHAIDMVPTVLDLLGIDNPESIKGVEQSDFNGISLKSTIDDNHARQDETIQYFEMFGCRSIYKDGWRAECGYPGASYAEGEKNGFAMGQAIHADDLKKLDETWQLFNLKDDPAESNDIAAKHPDRLKELIDLWWSEAEKHDVLPLQGTMGQRFNYPRPMPGDSLTHFVFYDGAIVPSVVQPVVYNRSHTIESKITVPKGGANGVIYATGGNTGGYTLFVKDNKLHFTYNYLTRTFYRWVADDVLPEGDVTILYEFETTGKGDLMKGNGAPGTATIYVNDKEVGSLDMPMQVPFLYSIEGLSVSHDYGDSVDHQNYQPPFPFTGTVKTVTYDLAGDAIENAEAETRRGMAHQ